MPIHKGAFRWQHLSWVRGFKEQAYRMPMSKKQLEKKQQAKKAELAELQKQADAGDGEAKKKIAKLKKKMK